MERAVKDFDTKLPAHHQRKWHLLQGDDTAFKTPVDFFLFQHVTFYFHAPMRSQSNPVSVNTKCKK